MTFQTASSFSIMIVTVTLHPENYPTDAFYPFSLPVLRGTRCIEFGTPVTLFVGENGSGKSTLLKALASVCGIHIWRNTTRVRFKANPYENKLREHITVDWAEGPMPGSYFGSDVFQYFVEALDEWAAADPGQLEYFGGQSLVTQSHGQSLMAYFNSRYRIPGLYLLDEPETALSPNSQLQLLRILAREGSRGEAQFIVATHSPILLACPGATIYSFDSIPVSPILYEDTEHYRVYRSFMEDRSRYLDEVG
ncbi:MAG: AAA family ATPase [Chloroflexota bacterium]|nr:AAA family ATPase [Chloroflexota bacterium]